MASLKKTYKKGSYEDRFILDKILSPLFKNEQNFTVGQYITLGRIIQEKLKENDLSLDELKQLKNIALNPSIDFMIKAISYSKKYAFCFAKNLNYKNTKNLNIDEENEEIIDLILTKKEIQNLIIG